MVRLEERADSEADTRGLVAVGELLLAQGKQLLQDKLRAKEERNKSKKSAKMKVTAGPMTMKENLEASKKVGIFHLLPKQTNKIRISLYLLQ